MPILVATDREVVVIDVERRHLRVGARNQRPSYLPRCGRARSRTGVVWDPPGRRVQDRRWRTVLAVVGLAGRLIMAIAASPVERDVVWVGTEPSEVWRSADAGDYVEADQPLGDIVFVVGVVVSAETGHSSRSLDRVPPART